MVLPWGNNCNMIGDQDVFLMRTVLLVKKKLTFWDCGDFYRSNGRLRKRNVFCGVKLSRKIFL